MNDLERRAVLSVAGLAGVALLAKSARGGPLEPPAGPVAPSNHTLDEIYNKIPLAGAFDGRIPLSGPAPITITTSGSYVLTAPLSASDPAVGAIFINASNVTLDLNGHIVSATSGSKPVIEINSGMSNVCIRNGTVIGGQRGVYAAASTSFVHVEDLSVVSAKLGGIVLPGTAHRSGLIRRCRVINVGITGTSADNGQSLQGIFFGGVAARITECTIQRFATSTFSPGTVVGVQAVGNGNFIERCCVIADGGGGAVAFSLGSGVTYRDNFAYGFTTPYGGGGVNGGGNL